MEKNLKINLEIGETLDKLKQLDSNIEGVEGSAKKLEGQMQSATDGYKTQAKEVGDINAKIQERLRQEMEDLAELRNRRQKAWSKKEIEEYDKRIQETGVNIRKLGGSFEELKKISDMNLKEMAKELSKIKSVNFDNLSTTEISALKKRMADLTDGIGDFRKQISVASADTIPALVQGLEGIVASTQLVTAGLSMFGVNGEKLNKIMIQLIGAGQALNKVYLLLEAKAHVRLALAVKEIALKTVLFVKTTALAAVTWVQVAAQNAWTASVLAFNTAVYNIPVLGWLLAIIGAIIGAVVLLVKNWEKLTSIFRSENAELGKYSESLQRVLDKIKEIDLQRKKEIKNLEWQLKLRKAEGASVEELRKIEKELMERRIVDHKTRIKQLEYIARMNTWVGAVAREAYGKEKVAFDKVMEEYTLKLAEWETDERNRAKKTAEEKTKIREKEKDEALKFINEINGRNTDAFNKRLEEYVKEQEKLVELRDKKLISEIQYNEAILNIRKAYFANFDKIEKMHNADIVKKQVKHLKTMLDSQIEEQLRSEGLAKDILGFEENAKTKREILKEFYEEGLILEKDYQKGIQELNAETVEKIKIGLDITRGAANAIGDLFSALAEKEEEGSERQRQLRKKAAIAQLIATQATATASLADAIIKAQALPPPANIIEGVRIGILGVSQIAQIIGARAQISKMKEGGSGMVGGRSHAQGGSTINPLVNWEQGEKYYVLSRENTQKYGHIMDDTFNQIQSGKIKGDMQVFAPNINLNDEYTQKIYQATINKTEVVHTANYIEIKTKNKTRRVV
jgi:hypothetical protein